MRPIEVSPSNRIPRMESSTPLFSKISPAYVSFPSKPVALETGTPKSDQWNLFVYPNQKLNLLRKNFIFQSNLKNSRFFQVLN